MYSSSKFCKFSCCQSQFFLLISFIIPAIMKSVVLLVPYMIHNILTPLHKTSRTGARDVVNVGK